MVVPGELAAFTVTVSPPRLSVTSLLAENEVNHPAAANVNLVGVAAVVEYLLIFTSDVLESVRENGHRTVVA